jgi:hypothetical protein
VIALQIEGSGAGGDRGKIFKAVPERPSVARFHVCGGQPPKLTSALFLAERMHLALVNLSAGSCVFTGCDSSHRPLQGHVHAYIFCECDPERDGRGEITNITVYARLGFGPREKAALERPGQDLGTGRAGGGSGPAEAGQTGGLQRLCSFGEEPELDFQNAIPFHKACKEDPSRCA